MNDTTDPERGPKELAVRMRNRTMSHWGLEPGTIVFGDPTLGRAAGYNRPVLARLLNAKGGDEGLVVMVLRLEDDGTEYLQSDGDEGDNDHPYRHFALLAVCTKMQGPCTPVRRQPDA